MKRCGLLTERAISVIEMELVFREDGLLVAHFVEPSEDLELQIPILGYRLHDQWS